MKSETIDIIVAIMGFLSLIIGTSCHLIGETLEAIYYLLIGFILLYLSKFGEKF